MARCSCGSETINVNGQVWSKHFEPAHWSRKNRGKPVKAEKPLTEAEIRAELSERFAELKQQGVVE